MSTTHTRGRSDTASTTHQPRAKSATMIDTRRPALQIDEGGSTHSPTRATTGASSSAAATDDHKFPTTRNTTCAPNVDSMKLFNLNLLLIRVKEKLANLQCEHSIVKKKYADLEVAHSKLTVSHSNLQVKAKSVEDSLQSKLTSVLSSQKLESDQFASKIAQLKNEMMRTASMKQSELQNEICALQSKVQEAQGNVILQQQAHETSRTQLNATLVQTQTILKETRLEFESTLVDLKHEREERLISSYTLSDKIKECDNHFYRAKRLDERCTELTELMTNTQQNILKSDAICEQWKTKYFHLRKEKFTLKQSKKQYATLLKYLTVSFFLKSHRLKKVIHALEERVKMIWGEVEKGRGGSKETRNDGAVANSKSRGGGRVPASSAFMQQLALESSFTDDSQQSDSSDPSSFRATMRSPERRKRALRRCSVKEIELAQKAADYAFLQKDSAAVVENDTKPNSSFLSTNQPSSLISNVVAATMIQNAANYPNNHSVLNITSAAPSDTSVLSVSAQLATRSPSTPATTAFPTPQYKPLPRYNINLIPSSTSTVDRDWQLHLHEHTSAGLSGNALQTTSHAAQSATRPQSSNILHLLSIEDRLALLQPILAELRAEISNSYSTNEGMFQRTLQLSRKILALQQHHSAEQKKFIDQSKMIDAFQTEIKRLKRFEYSYIRNQQQHGHQHANEKDNSHGSSPKTIMKALAMNANHNNATFDNDPLFTSPQQQQQTRVILPTPTATAALPARKKSAGSHQPSVFELLGGTPSSTSYQPPSVPPTTKLFDASFDLEMKKEEEADLIQLAEKMIQQDDYLEEEAERSRSRNGAEEEKEMTIQHGGDHYLTAPSNQHKRAHSNISATSAATISSSHSPVRPVTASSATPRFRPTTSGTRRPINRTNILPSYTPSVHLPGQRDQPTLFLSTATTTQDGSVTERNITSSPLPPTIAAILLNGAYSRNNFIDEPLPIPNQYEITPSHPLPPPSSVSSSQPVRRMRNPYEPTSGTPRVKSLPIGRIGEKQSSRPSSSPMHRPQTASKMSPSSLCNMKDQEEAKQQQQPIHRGAWNVSAHAMINDVFSTSEDPTIEESTSDRDVSKASKFDPPRKSLEDHNRSLRLQAIAELKKKKEVERIEAERLAKIAEEEKRVRAKERAKKQEAQRKAQEDQKRRDEEMRQADAELLRQAAAKTKKREADRVEAQKKAAQEENTRADEARIKQMNDAQVAAALAQSKQEEREKQAQKQKREAVDAAAKLKQQSSDTHSLSKKEVAEATTEAPKVALMSSPPAAATATATADDEEYLNDDDYLNEFEDDTAATATKQQEIQEASKKEADAHAKAAIFAEQFKQEQAEMVAKEAETKRQQQFEAETAAIKQRELEAEQQKQRVVDAAALATPAVVPSVPIAHVLDDDAFLDDDDYLNEFETKQKQDEMDQIKRKEEAEAQARAAEKQKAVAAKIARREAEAAAATQQKQKVEEAKREAEAKRVHEEQEKIKAAELAIEEVAKAAAATKILEAASVPPPMVARVASNDDEYDIADFSSASATPKQPISRVISNDYQNDFEEDTIPATTVATPAAIPTAAVPTVVITQSTKHPAAVERVASSEYNDFDFEEDATPIITPAPTAVPTLPPPAVTSTTIPPAAVQRVASSEYDLEFDDTTPIATPATVAATPKPAVSTTNATAAKPAPAARVASSEYGNDFDDELGDLEDIDDYANDFE